MSTLLPTHDGPTRLEPSAAWPEDSELHALLTAIRDAVVVGDARTGAVVHWNPAAERLFGHPAAEVLGRPLEVLVPERLRARHRRRLAAFARTGRAALVETGGPVEVPALRADGSEFTVELTSGALASDRPSARLILALVRDATGRGHPSREREAALAAAQDHARRLEELAAMRSTFAAMVAHELGTPLATIRGLTDLLIGGNVPPDQHRALAVAIRAEADVLRRLVADVQAAATVERGDFEVRPRPVPVAALIADAGAVARAQMGEGRVSVDHDPAATASRVRADPERIGQVLRNLVGNAAKHTPPGTPVTIRTRCDGGRVRVEVADAGPGVHPDDLRRIFQKFGRGRDAEGNAVPGMGLGLYLARRLVAAHGSELDVESTPGEGTVFGFALEVAP